MFCRVSKCAETRRDIVTLGRVLIRQAEHWTILYGGPPTEVCSHANGLIMLPFELPVWPNYGNAWYSLASVKQIWLS
jgi:hypothetical protein